MHIKCKIHARRIHMYKNYILGSRAELPQGLGEVSKKKNLKFYP